METEKVKKLRERLMTNSPVLTMNRVPKETVENFKKLANEQFCDDYGMTLKWIMDRWMLLEELIQSALFSNILAEHSSRISQLENKDSKVIKTLSGREVKKNE